MSKRANILGDEVCLIATLSPPPAEVEAGEWKLRAFTGEAVAGFLNFVIEGQNWYFVWGRYNCEGCKGTGAHTPETYPDRLKQNQGRPQPSDVCQACNGTGRLMVAFERADLPKETLARL